MSSLIEKMRLARQSALDLGEGKKLTVLRPTDLDAMGMQYKDNRAALEGVLPFITGWEGFTELDFYSGGTGEAVPYDPDLFAEWIKDHPEHWATVVSGVMDAYKQHIEKREERLKN